MADQLQLRGGPTAQSETFVGAEREITIDTGLKRLRLHDGTTPGGHILAAKVELDDAVATLNQTIADNEEADAKARADLKVLLEGEIADAETAASEARAQLQAAIDAEVAASAAYDVIQDNRIAYLEYLDGVNKKELSFITLIGSPAPAAGEVGVNAAVPSEVDMIVLPKTDQNGVTVEASDFYDGDRIALKQANGSAAIYTVDGGGTDTGDHLRLNLYMNQTVLGAAGDQAYEFDSGVEAVFEDSGATRALMTATVGVETTAREEAVASLTALITALQDRATVLEVDPVTKTYVDTQIADLVNGAPEALNQLSEIIAAFESADTDLLSDLSGLGVRITALEADATTASAVAAGDAALSARLDVLEADPITQADSAAADAVNAAAITAEETARIAADATTLSSANSYTDSQVAAGDATVTNTLTAQVTSEASTRAAADTALSARLDVLEVDPTTQAALTAAVAGVQADVDQNEADSDAAIAAEEARALAAEAAIVATHAADEADHEALELNAGLAFGQLYVGDLIVA